MKPTILLFLALLLTACTAVTPSPAPTVTPPPSATPAPTLTPTATPVPTPTPTPIPTLPPEQVGGLAGVPDPKVSNPELFNLNRSDAPIPQFVNAMKMGGIEVNPQEVVDNLQYQPITGVDGKQYVIGSYNLDPDPNQQGETLEGPIPLVIGNGEGWRKVGLDKFGIPFGTALWFKSKEGTIYEPRYDKIVSENFSQATISSGIHWKWLEREPDIIDYKWSVNYDMKGQLQQLDKFRNIKIVKLHSLFFPQFAPEWLNNMTANEVLRQMEEHVSFLASRYKGRVQEVDVVNEPFYQGPLFTGEGTFTREDVFYRKLGPDYIIKAFEMARRYFGPDVQLVYNDLANHSQRYGPNGGYYQNTLNNINRLKQEGLVDIVGCQMHLDAAYPPTKAEMIEAFRSYGIPVEITELDVRLDHLRNISAQERMIIQAKIYRDVIAAALESGVVQSITVWDVGDKYSYYEHWGGGSENSDAQLFDENFNPRPAYYAVLQVLFDYARK